MQFIGIIPARYKSTRFPGKPLADIGGKTMIQRVVEQASKALQHVFVATDDDRIYNAVLSFGGNAIMTSEQHPSGTDRVREAYEHIAASLPQDQQHVIINIQGDEPFIQPSQIEAIKHCFTDYNDTQIATLVRPYTTDDTLQDLLNPNTPKVVFAPDTMQALYFSRSVIPYKRGSEQTDWLREQQYYRHIGMYAYRADILRQITELPQGFLEKAESLEQLRWLEHGYHIRVAITNAPTIGIDTPQDLQKALQFLNMLK